MAKSLAFLLTLWLITGLARADPEAIANYAGADRAEYLRRGAQKEAALLLYTNIAAIDVDKIVADFEKRYGVKVQVWRAGPDKVLQRILTEAAANRLDVDVVHLSSPEMEALHREGLLRPVRSPHLKELRAEAVPAHGAWAASFLSVWVQAYNTKQVKKEELPKTYYDLLDPKWKGKLGIEAKNQEWFYTIVKHMGEAKGLQFFKDLVATNGLSVRTGTSLLNNLVVSGEIALALTVYNFMPEQAKQKGAAVDWFAIEPAIARANAVGVSGRARHPHAAVLFYDYMISDAQKLLAAMHHVPTDKKVASPLKNIRITLVDPAGVLDESEKSTRLYEEIVLRQSK
ncbi:MAG: extracellular solute-binding protein [Burkholderiales bacterium]|nr:extracellular solute-binding protein [Burkholderiales bacterium]